MKKEADFGQARSNRRFHFLLQAILMVGLVVGVNFVATRFHVRKDLSKMDNHVLSPKTKKVLAGLEEPIDVIVTITERGDHPLLLLQLLQSMLSFLA